MTVIKENPAVERLNDELWQKIEKAEGYAFVSDGEAFKTETEFFARMRGRLKWQRKTVKIMEAFLRKHGEL
jgi:hypothetical protein